MATALKTDKAAQATFASWGIKWSTSEMKRSTKLIRAHNKIVAAAEKSA